MSRRFTRRTFVGGMLGGTLTAGCGQSYNAFSAMSYAQFSTIKRAPVANARQAPVADTCKSPSPADLVVDVHCHTFNARDLPIDGFVRSLAQGMGLPAVLDPVIAPLTRLFHEALVEVTKIEEEIEAAPESTSVDAASRLKSAHEKRDAALAGLRNKIDELVTFYKIFESAKDAGLLPEVRKDASNKVVPILETMVLIANTRRKIANSIANQYCQVELFTPALVDFGYWIKRYKVGEVYDADLSPAQQIEEHAKIITAAKKGELERKNVSFHPFVAFNPWRHVAENRGDGRTILKSVQEAVESKGFIGVKLYPPSGFVPLGNAYLHDLKGEHGRNLDAALEELYEWCTDKDVPILTHASMGNSFFKDSSWRASPWGWRHALEKHNDLRVCFGHFGHMQGIDGKTAPVNCLAWAEGFLELMKTYPNVYGDVSNSLAGFKDRNVRETYQSQFLFWLCGRLSKDEKKVLAHRLLYGSDWWMGVISGDDAGFFDQIADMVKTSMGEYTKSAKEFPPDFWFRNSLRFLGIIGDDGKVRTNERSTGYRLREYYKDATRPRWLEDTTVPA